MGLTGAQGALPRHYTSILHRARRPQTGRRRCATSSTCSTIACSRCSTAPGRNTASRSPSSAAATMSSRITCCVWSAWACRRCGIVCASRTRSCMYYAGLLAQRPRAAVALEGILQDYFGVPVEVEQFTGAWFLMNADALTRIGADGQNHQLGVDAALWERVWDPQARFPDQAGPAHAISSSRISCPVARPITTSSSSRASSSARNTQLRHSADAESRRRAVVRPRAGTHQPSRVGDVAQDRALRRRIRRSPFCPAAWPRQWTPTCCPTSCGVRLAHSLLQWTAAHDQPQVAHQQARRHLPARAGMRPPACACRARITKSTSSTSSSSSSKAARPTCIASSITSASTCSRLSKELATVLDTFKTGNARTPALSPRLPQIFERAWVVASVDLGAPRCDRAIC